MLQTVSPADLSTVLIAVSVAVGVISLSCVKVGLLLLWPERRELLPWAVSSILLAVGHLGTVGVSVGLLDVPSAVVQSVVLLSILLLGQGVRRFFNASRNLFLVHAGVLVAGSAFLFVTGGPIGSLVFLGLLVAGILLPAVIFIRSRNTYRLCAIPMLLRCVLAVFVPVLLANGMLNLTVVLSGAVFMLQGVALIAASAMRRNASFIDIERPLSALLNRMSTGALRRLDDEAGTVIFANRACRELFGATSSPDGDRRSMNYRGRIAAEDRDRVDAAIADAIRGDHHYEVSYRIRVPGRDEQVVREQGTVLFDRIQQSWVIEAQVFDVTALNRAEDDLKTFSERYLDAARIARLGHWIHDESADRIVYCSDEMARIHGVSPEDYLRMVSSTDADVRQLHPDDRQRYERVLRQAQKDISSYDVEYRIVRPDGEIRHVREIGELVAGPDGRLAESRGTLQDITDQKARDRELQESDDRFRQAERIAHLFNWRTGRDFNDWEYASDNASLVYGRPVDDFLGHVSGYAEIMHPDDRAAVLEMYDSLNASPRAYGIEYRILDTSGEVRWVHEAGEPIFDDAGDVAYFQGVTQDISRIKETEAALKVAMQEADNANRAKSTFLAQMSHELRTPLNSIIGFNEMMRLQLFGRLGSEKYVDYVETIGFSAHHLLDLINDILDLSRIESGKMELNETTIDASQLVENVLKLTRQRIEKSAQKLEVVIDDDLPRLLVDTRLIEQVVVNLVSNASKFTEPGGQIRLVVRRSTNGGAVIEVEDNGVGIPSEDLPSIMEPFTQSGRRSDTSREGTGLGLAISRRLTELHQGELSVASTPGKGTSVTVSLPSSRFAAG